MQLYAKYPNMPMMLGLVTVKPPNLTIANSNADFVIPGNVDVYVVNATTHTNIPAFTLGIVSIHDCAYVANLIFTVLFNLSQNVYADVKVTVAPSGGKEIISANLTFLK